MYERFTDRARKVMQLGNEEALRLGHEYVGTEHILLGLVKEGAGVAGNVLKNLEMDLPKVRREVEGIVQRGPKLDPMTTQKLPQTPRAKKVVEYAIEEAHLLFGLLREQEGVSAQVLMNLGLTLNGVRREVLNLLGHNLPDEPTIRRQWVDAAKLPDEVQAVVEDLDAKIDELTLAKENAIAGQDWESAARLRDRAANLLRATFAILREWARRKPDEPSAS
jgi:ATP-dependent Clp protease ATP-binding subunit ClpC